MNYWWVYQGESFARAFTGGYLWAPQQTRAGKAPFYYWSNVTEVKENDIVFSHFKGYIAAVGVARRPAYTAPAPDPRDAPRWNAQGWRADVDFCKVRTPVTFTAARDALLPLVPHVESPFAADGRPRQGYLFRLPEPAGIALELLIGAAGNGNVLDSLTPPPNGDDGPTTTSAQAQVLVRVGQSLFRKRLDDLWENRCAVSNVRTRSLLRASHIKGWSEADNAERLDRYNGLLLSAAYDAAFDDYLITFEHNGSMVLSPQLNVDDASRAGLNTGARLRFILPEHLPYLAWHRERLRR